MTLTSQDLQAIGDLFDSKLDVKFDIKLKPIEAAIKENTVRLEKHSAQFEAISAQLEEHSAQLKEHSARFEGISAQIEGLSTRIKNVELTLENEVMKAINVIGEGHSFLSHKLDEALKITNDSEMLQLRVLNIEMDLRDVKQKLDTIQTA